jgi:hypothetical protein
MTEESEITILTVDVRRNRFGYALFEGPNRLFDWGAGEVSPRLSDKAGRVQARKRIRSLLRLRQPTALVLRRCPSRRHAGNLSEGPILKTVVKEALERQIPIHFVSRQEINAAFRVLDVHNKNEIAILLTRMFPELIMRLPRRRKSWQSESRSMIIFDAIAAGLVYWLRKGAQLPPLDSVRIP